MVEDAGAEEHGCKHERHEVLQALVVENAYVFEVVAGFGVADGFFDTPAFEVGANEPPQAPFAPATAPSSAT